MSEEKGTPQNPHPVMKELLHEVSEVDKHFSGKLHRMRLRKPLEWLVLLPALLFGRYFLPILVILFSLFINVRMGLYIALCCLITVVITEPMKYLFGRQRPCEENISHRVVPIRKDLTNPAFPSGDSAQAAVIGGVLFSLTGRYVFFLLPLPTMFARVYFGAHWIGDTLGGYAIGVAMGMYVVPSLVTLILRLLRLNLSFQ